MIQNVFFYLDENDFAMKILLILRMQIEQQQSGRWKRCKTHT